MPLPAVVIVIIEGAAVLAAKKLAQEAAKKAAQELAKKAAQEAAKKAAQEAAKKTAQEAVKKTAAQTAKKVGNTPLNKYLDKAMNKLSKFCQKAVKKLGAHIHGRKGDVIQKGAKVESNHIIQNAMLEGARGKGSEICPDYKASRAPSVPLTQPKHKATTRGQRTDAQAHRDAGTQPTYDEAREQAKKQAVKNGASKRDAECLMKFTDEVFRQLCPDLVDKNKPMRTPQR
jgi:hypothetical protein